MGDSLKKLWEKPENYLASFHTNPQKNLPEKFGKNWRSILYC